MKPGRKKLRESLRRVAMGVSVSQDTRATLEAIRDKYGVSPGVVIDNLMSEHARHYYSV